MSLKPSAHWLFHHFFLAAISSDIKDSNQLSMTSHERSLKASFTYTGLLLIAEGFLFLLFPHLATRLLLLSPLQTDQAVQYARATGLGVAIVGYYYHVAGKYTLIDFYRYSDTSEARLDLRLFPLERVLPDVYSVSQPL